jgi:hypothetical protein
MFKFVFAFVFVFLSLAAGNVSAQTPFGSPDNRYTQRVDGQPGFPSSLVPKFKSAPDLTSCDSQPAYEPAATHLMRFTTRVKVAKVRIQATDECVGMRTAAGDKWVRRVKGTKVAVDELGRDLFDFGSPTGQACGNPRPFSIPLGVPAATVTVTSAPVVVAFAPEPPAPAEQPAEPRLTPTFVIPPPQAQAPQPAAVVPALRPTPPPAPRPYNPSRTGLVVTLGVGYAFGSVNSTYQDALPQSGDVPQKHRFATVVPVLRVDQSADHGLFGSVSAGVLGKTSGILFQDITGSWINKKRDTDTSRDDSLNAKVGYKHAIADNVSVGGFGGYSKLCLCEVYTAQGATTTTQRSYQGLILGGELSGASRSDSHRVQVNVVGNIGPSQTRKSWTHQVYPGITFPRVDHADEKAKSFGLHVEGDVQATGIVHLTVAYDYTGLSSTRPDTFTAHEHVNVSAVTIGVNIKWAK